MTLFRKALLSFILIFILSCSSSEEDCEKTIIVQYGFTISSPTGTTIIPEISQVLDCDFPEPDVAETIEEFQRLNAFSYEVTELIVIPDTGNNFSSVSYKITISNLSDANVKGIPYVTTRINNDSFTSTSANTSNCLELQANSSCEITYDVESSLNLGSLTSFEIIDVNYLITQ
ncbi:hypothetical protein [Polaribacter sp.]|uniref:hypothetical protein n=1 Tax=Polaribacter sp. TaxID=1920175 RepID=UPI0025E6365A|nr:hypothetical protein [Polaribacter sp.]